MKNKNKIIYRLNYFIKLLNYFLCGLLSRGFSMRRSLASNLNFSLLSNESLAAAADAFSATVAAFLAAVPFKTLTVCAARSVSLRSNDLFSDEDLLVGDELPTPPLILFRLFRLL